jgi:energy-coupling factor transport system ATP-binding protein
MAREKRAARLETLLSEWRLGGLERLHPFELSQGQKRRLALATLAAAERWPLLVLDEPLAGLDARGAVELVRHVEALAQSGRAVVVITHDMDFALRLCPRSVVLGEGRILADGPTADLLADRGLLKRAGLAEPAIAPARRWL